MNRFLFLSMRTVRRPLSSTAPNRAPHSSSLSNGTSSLGERSTTNSSSGSRSWAIVPLLSAVIALQCFIIAQQSSVVDNIKKVMTDRKEQQRLELLLLLKIMSFHPAGRYDDNDNDSDGHHHHHGHDESEKKGNTNNNTTRSSQSRSSGSGALSAV